MKALQTIRFWHILMLAVFAFSVSSCDLTLVEEEEDAVDTSEDVISENINSLVVVDDPDLHVEVSPDVKVNEATRGISKEFNQQYLVKRDSMHLYFQGVPESEKPKVGEILVAGKYCMEYTGYMVKVTDVVDEGDMTIVTCKRAELNEAFDKLEVNASKILVSPEVEEQLTRSRIKGQSPQTRWSWYQDFASEEFSPIDEKDLIFDISVPGGGKFKMGFEYLKLSGTLDLHIALDTEKDIYELDCDVNMNPQYSFIADFGSSRSTRSGSDEGNALDEGADTRALNISFNIADITDLPMPAPMAIILDRISRFPITLGIPAGTTGVEVDISAILGAKFLSSSFGATLEGAISSKAKFNTNLTASTKNEDFVQAGKTKNNSDDTLFKLGGFALKNGSFNVTPIDVYIGVAVGGSILGGAVANNATGHGVVDLFDFQVGAKFDYTFKKHEMKYVDSSANFMAYGKIVLLSFLEKWGFEIPIIEIPLMELERAIIQTDRDIEYGFQDADDTYKELEPGLIISDNEKDVEIGFYFSNPEKPEFLPDVTEMGIVYMEGEEKYDTEDYENRLNAEYDFLSRESIKGPGKYHTPFGNYYAKLDFSITEELEEATEYVVRPYIKLKKSETESYYEYGSLKKFKLYPQWDPNEYKIIRTGFVDLHEDLDVEWAACNFYVDPSREIPEASGNYFGWGKTDPDFALQWMWPDQGSATYHPDNRWYYPLDKEDISQDSEFDVVTKYYKKLGIPDYIMYHIPTFDQWNDLVSTCRTEVVTYEGQVGIAVIGQNREAIFLPCSGYRRGKKLTNNNLTGNYWTATASNEEEATSMVFEPTKYGSLVFPSRIAKCARNTIRPVLSKGSW